MAESLTSEEDGPEPMDEGDDDDDDVLAIESYDSSDEKSESSSSLSDSSEDAFTLVLPRGAPDTIQSVPVIPTQFTRQDYTKMYALRSYDQCKALRKELKKLRSWWTKRHNAERQGQPIAATTALKREERILCFLGFVFRYRSVQRNTQLTVALILNHRLVQAYLEYLKKVRETKDGNIVEHMSALIAACKWLYRKEPLQLAEPILRRFKDWRNIYSARAARARNQCDKEELQEQGRWLDWTTFTDLVKSLRVKWEDECAGDAPATADEALQLHDLLLLGLYTCIPGRGAEVRLLQYIPPVELDQHRRRLGIKQYVDKQRINLLTHSTDTGDWTMYVSQYKNYRSRGVDSTNMASFEWWTRLFAQYWATYRPLLIEEGAHRFVFVTRSGHPFTANYFSTFVANLLRRHTGNRVATNLLRSSFVTHFYDSSASNQPDMRESVAHVMRHSVKEAQRTYDRRTAGQRKRQGLGLLASLMSSQKKAKSDIQEVDAELLDKLSLA